MKALARQGFQPGFVRSSFRLAIFSDLSLFSEASKVSPNIKAMFIWYFY
jgi:hypothetical protein